MELIIYSYALAFMFYEVIVFVISFKYTSFASLTNNT